MYILTTSTVFVGIPEGKRPLERPRCGWEDNIEMDVFPRLKATAAKK
jgi:hypothetical protein